MCVYVSDATRDFSTLGDLRGAGLTVMPEDHDPDWSDDECLCGVDVDAILCRSGVSWDRDSVGDYVIRGVLP